MNRGVSVGLVAILVATLALSGCESDTTVAASEDPNEDQALSLSVLGARGDTLTAAVENEVAVDTGLPPDLRPVSPPPPTTPAPGPSFAPAVVQATPAPRQIHTPVAPVPKREPKPEARVIAEAPVVVRDVEPVRRRIREQSSDEVSAPTGLIPKGATLSVVTTRAVCNDDAAIGNTFRAELSSSARGSNGTVIPEGAQVVARITSVDKWGAGIGVQVTSVRFGGRSYPVTSRVGYVLPEGGDRGPCIKPHARLDVETKEPIRVTAQR